MNKVDERELPRPEETNPGLPRGWAVTTIGQLAEALQYGYTASATKRPGPRFLRITDIQDGKVDWSKVPSCDINPEALEKYALAHGDIVFARTGATTGKTYLIRNCPQAVFASYLIRLRITPHVLPEYVFMFFQSLTYWEQIEKGKRGIGQPNVNAQILSRIRLPLCPLKEQARIVAEIETQFTRLDAAVAALKRVQKELKRYRASVLKAACEGRLLPTEAELARTEGRDYQHADQLLACILKERRAKWEAGQLSKMKTDGREPRGDNWMGKYRQPKPPRIGRLQELPGGWTWATIEQVNIASRPCSYGVLQPGPHVEGGIRLIRVGDIENGRILSDDLKRIDSSIEAEYSRTRLLGNEVLITLVGAIGRTAVVPRGLAGANTARAVGVIPICDEIEPKWVELWLRNPERVAEMTAKAHEVARKTLNLEDVRATSIALPPVAEQRRVIAEAERRLSLADEAESFVTASLKRSEKLRQAILRLAFAGTLVDQDPCAEPATALLERIHSERADAMKPLGLDAQKANRPRGKRAKAANRSSQEHLFSHPSDDRH